MSELQYRQSPLHQREASPAPFERIEDSTKFRLGAFVLPPSKQRQTVSQLPVGASIPTGIRSGNLGSPESQQHFPVDPAGCSVFDVGKRPGEFGNFTNSLEMKGRFQYRPPLPTASDGPGYALHAMNLCACRKCQESSLLFSIDRYAKFQVSGQITSSEHR